MNTISDTTKDISAIQPFPIILSQLLVRSFQGIV
jgi:hypothetical protein